MTIGIMDITGSLIVIIFITMLIYFLKFTQKKNKGEDKPAFTGEEFNYLNKQLTKKNRELQKYGEKIEKLEKQNKYLIKYEKQLTKEKRAVVKEKDKVDNKLFKLRKKLEGNEKKENQLVEYTHVKQNICNEIKELKKERDCLVADVKKISENNAQLSLKNENYLKNSNQKNGSKLADSYHENDSIPVLLPKLDFTYQSVKEIIEMVHNKKNILNKLYRLNRDPKEVRSEHVESTKSWNEAHFHTGVNNDGRLYYKHNDHGKLEVYVGLKKTQKRDIKFLVKHD
jgi:DNA repair exonuclease SbcCD ATPase subunit